MEYVDILNMSQKLYEKVNIKNNKANKIVLLTNARDESYTAPAIEKECKKRGIKFKLIDINNAALTLIDGGFVIEDSKGNIKIYANDTAILARRGVIRNTATREIVRDLHNNGFFVVNTLEAILKCENKYITSKILEEAGLVIPKMSLIVDIDNIEKNIEEIGGKFPVVLKMLSGTQGIGVSIVDSYQSLKSVLQTFLKMDEEAEFFIQEKIEADYDIRIQVLNKWNNLDRGLTQPVILGSMKRNKVDKDFRTNYSLGGTVEKIKITKDQEDIAIKASQVLNCSWCGVDLMVCKKTGKNYILEVNASPGTKGFMEATKVDIIKEIIDYLEDRSNWAQKETVVGFREWIHVEKVGDVVAKFDTGNGALASSIHADKINVDEEKKIVRWAIGGKKFKSELVGWSDVKTSDGKKASKRPIIHLDLTFNNKTAFKTEVALNDRSIMSAKFLINRSLMREWGCYIDPTRVFIIKPYDEKEEYSTKKAIKDPHYGIRFEK